MRMIEVSRDELMDYAQQHRAALQGYREAAIAEGSLQQWLHRRGRGDGQPVIRGQNLRHVDLSYADLSGVRIDGSTLEGAVLDQASLQQAQLPRTCLKDVQAFGTTFAGADLRGCNFAGARLLGGGPITPMHQRKETDFTAANLNGADFSDAHCRNVLFTSAFMEGVKFRGAVLENTRFNHASLVGADFTASQPQFRKAVGTRAHPVGVEFTGSILLHAKGMEGYAGHTELAMHTVEQLTGAVERITAMGSGQKPLLDTIRQQLETRRSAAGAVLERSAEGTQGLAQALYQLNKVQPVAGGFAQKLREGNLHKEERGR
jgi:hypothetical protein